MLRINYKDEGIDNIENLFFNFYCDSLIYNFGNEWWTLLLPTVYLIIICLLIYHVII